MGVPYGLFKAKTGFVFGSVETGPEQEAADCEGTKAGREDGINQEIRD